MGQVGTVPKGAAHFGLKGMVVIQFQVMIQEYRAHCYPIFQCVRDYEESRF